MDEQLTEREFEAASRVRDQARVLADAIAMGRSVDAVRGLAVQMEAEVRDFLRVLDGEDGGMEDDPQVAAVERRLAQIDGLVSEFRDYLMDKEREDLVRDQRGEALFGMVQAHAGMGTALEKRVAALEREAGR